MRTWIVDKTKITVEIESCSPPATPSERGGARLQVVKRRVILRACTVARTWGGHPAQSAARSRLVPALLALWRRLPLPRPTRG